MNDDTIGVFGHIEIETVCKKTGERTLIFEDKNRVVNTGFQSFLGSLVDRDQYQYGFDAIYFGDDVGSGTIFDPEPATPEVTTSDQNTIYRVPNEDTFTQFPANNKLRFVAMIDGDDLFKTTGVPRNLFTSVSIRNNRGDIVAYKRFAGISSSPLLSISIRWTITILDQCKDIPHRYVTDVNYYVINDMIGLDGTDLNYPIEVSSGIGQFTKDIHLPHDQDTFYLITMQEWSDGTTSALDWNDTTPVGNATAQFDEDIVPTTYEHKSYIQTIKVKNYKNIGMITVCSEGVCEILTVSKEWRLPQVTDGVIPVGYLPKSEWVDNKYWKFGITEGALFGPIVIDDIYGATPHTWYYYLDGNVVVLENGNTGQMHRRVTDGNIKHVSATFDNNFKPVIVWERGDIISVNAWNDDTLGYETHDIGHGLSPYVFNHGMNQAFDENTPPTIVYVDPTNNQMVTRNMGDGWVSKAVVEDNVSDILAAGLTTLNSIRVIYTHDNNGVPEIKSIATDRYGAVDGEQSFGSSITTTITEIGFF